MRSPASLQPQCRPQGDHDDGDDGDDFNDDQNWNIGWAIVLPKT